MERVNERGKRQKTLVNLRKRQLTLENVSYSQKTLKNVPGSQLLSDVQTFFHYGKNMALIVKGGDYLAQAFDDAEYLETREG